MRQAVEAGRSVVSLGRSARDTSLPATVMPRPTDVLDGDAVKEIFRDADSETRVVSTLGGSPPDQSADALGNLNVIQTAAEFGIRTFLLVTSLGCGESRAHASERLLAAIGDTLTEKTRAEEAMQRAIPESIILRPGRLVDGTITGGGIRALDPSVHGNIARDELARMTLEALGDPAARGKIWSVIDPGQNVPD